MPAQAGIQSPWRPSPGCPLPSSREGRETPSTGNVCMQWTSRGKRATGGGMDDLIVQGGIIAGKRQDIAIQNGRICQLAPELHSAARERLEVTGKLVLPGFVESHLHPDKAFV